MTKKVIPMKPAPQPKKKTIATFDISVAINKDNTITVTVPNIVRQDLQVRLGKLLVAELLSYTKEQKDKETNLLNGR